MKWYDGKDDPISWFFQNLDKPNFSQTEVLVLAGKRLKAVTLQNWTNRQYVKPKIVGGKRRYSALEVASISLAQPLVSNLAVDPSSATLIIVHALLIFQRKLKSKEFSSNEVSHILGAVGDPVEEPIFIDARKVAPILFETRDALVVLPFGRLLSDLAKRQRELIEFRLSAGKTA
ncbi:hypothetical protein IVB22_26965 [Bradyrhizobium sp. 190]|uniref:hypothetical protein n=1 Tax=Bradyrhizobium sp. 190 TaxID=2782658 RepID=UPI001FFB1252|nr:hypothetical protein [Bradyrhizobium sp. 190]MCK1516118.1 hypothetical protein [Bradyrhizobium sp. 190]